MIVIPMAGLSRRFFDAGYSLPKFQLDLHGRPVFDYALASFVDRFAAENFLFAMRPDYDTEAFVSARVKELGIASAQFVVLDQTTKGQADTVRLALQCSKTSPGEPITIFNVDSFRPGFSMTDEERDAAGYLEVFIGEGDGWSFVEPAQVEGHSHGRVARVVEKVRISDFCSTGLYYFRSRSLFDEACLREFDAPTQVLAESYVAPLYNQLIARSERVLYRVINRSGFIACGTPAEYHALRENPRLLQTVRWTDEAA